VREERIYPQGRQRRISSSLSWQSE
jgi:hypothetical protein